MALTLFRSYALLIVLCIFMIFIDDSAQADGEIPQGCNVVFSEDNSVLLPKRYIMRIYNGSEEWDNYGNDTTVNIITLPDNWIVIFPDGFKIIQSNGEIAPFVPEFTGGNSSECIIYLENEWSIIPTPRIKNGPPEESNDVILYAYHSGEYGEIPQGCNVVVSGKNQIILPKQYQISIPDGSEANLNPWWNYGNETTGYFITLPDNWIVTMPAGFIIMKPNGDIVDFPAGLKPPFSIDHTGDNSSECIIYLEDGVNVMSYQNSPGGTPESQGVIIVHANPPRENGGTSEGSEAYYSGEDGYSSDEY